MAQVVMHSWEEGNNQKYSSFIPFSKPAGAGGKKGNNTYRLFPLPPRRFAEGF